MSGNAANLLAVSTTLCLLSLQAIAQSPSTAAVPTGASAAAARNDYSRDENWLCRPGRQDACSVDLTTTIVAADGRMTREEFKADPAAPIDCFYVYPTVSLDTTPNSDMIAGREERSVIQQQFARFAAQCRTFAPLYRQVTLTALRSAMAGAPLSADRALGYGDVLDAWNHYLQHDNRGRGVVLIGHSQGSSVLTQLIRNEIDGKPIQSKLVAAMLIGTNVAVPKGRDVGGAFTSVPLCKSAQQTGCVISYVTFRADVPPPPNSRFGRVAAQGQQAACVNPAALSGANGSLHAYLAAQASMLSSSLEPKPWVSSGEKVSTPFVSVPGLLSAQCVDNEHGSYLAIKVNGDPQDPRTDDIVGDVAARGAIQKDWGLHLIDVNLAMGDLLQIVASQSRAYTRK